MKYLRKWDLPTLEEPVCEHLDRAIGWGKHYFWYCFKCRSIYASAMLSPEDCSQRPWHGVGGLCMTCVPDRFCIRGELAGAPAICADISLEVAEYILNREIDFIGHPAHPHNEV